jgi:polysaccharide biosynthesis transport protein
LDCWTTIRAHSRLIVTLVVASLSLTTAAVILATPNYTSYALLRIDPEAPRILDVTQLLSQIENTVDHDYYKTEFELLDSEELAADVIHDLDLQTISLFHPDVTKSTLVAVLDGRLMSWVTHPLTPSESLTRTDQFLGASKFAIDTYLDRIEIEPVTSTRLVRVSFRSPNRGLSVKIVDAHVKAFLRLNQSLRRQAGESSRMFLGQELVEIKAKVEKSEADLNAYRTRNGILAFGINDQAKNRIAEQRMSALTDALTDAQNQRIKAEAQLQVANAGDFDTLPAVIDNPIIENLKPEFDRLQAQYAELRSKYTGQYPLVGDAKARLDASGKRLSIETASIARAVERNYNAALNQERDLQQQVAQEKQADIELNNVSLQDAILVREVQTNRQLYRDVLRRMHELSVESDAPLPNISIVQSAQMPPYPSSPRPLKWLTIAGLLTMVVGVGVAFVAEQCNDRLRGVEDIEHYLQIPELGIVPDFSKLDSRRSVGLPSLTAVLYATASLGSRNIALIGPPSALSPPSVLLERRMRFYKSIRAAILYSRAGTAPKTILFVSALPNEGKTMTAVSTALAFAQTGARTLLIDTDLHAPHCHRLLNVENLIGLSDVIVGRERANRAIHRVDAWHLDNYQGLYLLGAGHVVPNPGELLTSVTMHHILIDLGNIYQFLLLDSAPITFSSETLGLATMVDGVVIVAAVTTPKQMIRSMCRRLAAAGATIYGLVLNKAEIRQRAYQTMGPYYADYKSSYHDRPDDDGRQA